MAETMQFELVSPSRRVAGGEAMSVVLPAAEGEMTAMPRHAPFITAIRPGVVTVRGTSGESRFVVAGGFVEVTPEEVGILADDAEAVEKVDRAWLDTVAQTAEKTLEGLAEDDERRLGALQHVHDVRALGALLDL